MSDSVHIDNIQNYRKERELAEAKEAIAIEKALKSDNAESVVKAMEMVSIKSNQTNSEDRKAFYVDPIAFNEGFGFKTKPTTMTYDTLYRMSKAPVINAIIKTRKNQVAAFATPQKDMFSTGFVIRKKGAHFDETKELSSAERTRIEEATDFILQCGSGYSWDRDSFETFLRKCVEDTLVYDQLNYEVVRNNRGIVTEWVAVDPTTIRRSHFYKMMQQGGAAKGIAGYDPFAQQKDAKRKLVGGYLPHAVQVYMERPVPEAEFYPWELSFALRNPSSRIHTNGYGRSELEDMVSITTSMLWSDQYNQNFFKLGSAPKGILRIKGGTNNPRLQDFRQRWMSMVSGVANSHRVPVIDSETAEWIDLQNKNRDMEFSKWQEYNIKLGCALYTIDPSEIGFKFSDGEQKPLFESNNASKLKHSKDKGLAPLLKFLEADINKMILSQTYPDLYFEFVGYDAMTEDEYLEKIAKENKNLKTLNEVRADRNLPPLEHGDMLLDPTYFQAVQAAQMNEQMMGGEGEEGMGFGEGGDMEGEEEAPAMDGRGFTPSGQGAEEEEDPFMKSFQKMVDDIEKGRI